MITNDLAKLLKDKADEAAAWVAEDPANRWAASSTQDAAHWAGMGITTVEAYNHYCLVCDVYETTREVFGYKPNWAHLNGLTTAELETQAAHLAKWAREEQDAIAREEAQIVADDKAHAEATAKALTHRTGFSIGEISLVLA